METIVLPVLPHNCYLVMDIASVHNNDRLAQILAQKDITLVKLPPYSSDLNRIEMVFCLAKTYFLFFMFHIFYISYFKDIDKKAERILSAFIDISAVAIQNICRCSWRIQ